MLIIHGTYSSSGVRRILVCFFQMGLVEGKEFQVEQVAGFDVLKTPEWMVHQPFGQMPWMEDTETGFELFEARAICKYAAAKFSSDLLPPASDIERRALFEQACSVETQDFDAHATKTAFECIIKSKLFGLPPDKYLVDWHVEALTGRLDGYEKILAKTRYLAGDQMTLADLFHLPAGSYVVGLGLADGMRDGTLPNLTRWWKELSELKSWAATNAYLP
ncbi:glutathione S-transferase, partial [Tremellales sp. Uapishka_1]